MSVDITGSFDDLIHISQLIFEPTQGDLAYAMDLQGIRMLERTAQGIDYEGSPFAEYDKKHPYYAYPAGKGSKGVRYDSYDSFKKSLGRLAVDLLGGYGDPHMLDKFQLRVDGLDFKFRGGDYDTHKLPAVEVTLGIYQSKGLLAYFHNEGEVPQPRREFFAISSEDRDRIFEDIARSIQERLVKAYGH